MKNISVCVTTDEGIQTYPKVDFTDEVDMIAHFSEIGSQLKEGDNISIVIILEDFGVNQMDITNPCMHMH